MKRKFFKTPPRVSVGQKADSWRESATLGLSNGLFWAPTALWELTKKPLAQIIDGTFGLVTALALFIFTRIMVVSMGLAGRLRHTGWGMTKEVNQK